MTDVQQLGVALLMLIGVGIWMWAVICASFEEGRIYLALALGMPIITGILLIVFGG